MNKCIYLKTGENQTFDKEEHIFPAALGGIEKLPKGYVSDYINGEYFSKLELTFMRESPIAIYRMFLGPGKRGNLNKKNATKSKIGVYYNEKDKEDITLGYIKKGKPYQIEQLKVTDIKENNSLTCNLISDNEGDIDNFVNIVEKININEDLKRVNLYDKSLGKKDFIIAYDNHKAYMLTHDKNINFEYIQETINKVVKEYRNRKYRINSSKTQPRINLNLTFNIYDFYRICAKIAFNYLAFKKGQEYVLNEKFDKLRSFILGETRVMNCRIIEKDVPCHIETPQSSHKIFLQENKGYLYAIISFFGITNVFVELCKNDLDCIEQDNIFCGYICDWKSRKEYDFIEFINLIE